MSAVQVYPIAMTAGQSGVMSRSSQAVWSAGVSQHVSNVKDGGCQQSGAPERPPQQYRKV